MPNVSSPQVEQVIEAINDTLGKFSPEKVVPDVEALLENLPKIADALSDAVKKLADRLTDELPVHSDVPEALREMIPAFGTMRDRSDEAYSVFKSRHAQELDQHYNPRAGEKAWNTDN